jgi:hypothetical protein
MPVTITHFFTQLNALLNAGARLHSRDDHDRIMLNRFAAAAALLLRGSCCVICTGNSIELSARTRYSTSSGGVP